MATSLSKLNISQWVVSLTRDDNSLSSAQAIATSVTLPNLTKNFDNDPRSGLPGVVSIPLQFGEMEMSISFKGAIEDFLSEIAAQQFKPVKFDLSAIGCDMYDNSELSVRVIAVGYLKDSLGMELPAQDSATSEITIMVNKIQIKVGATDILYIPQDFIYLHNGVNLLEPTADNLNITPGTTTSLII